jgi:hypothetical protein
MKKGNYKKEYPRLMYSFFLGYEKSEGAPSFEKFAQKIGVTLERLNEFRKKPEFDRAYRECNEIRRDYLIDTALNKRADGSFVKFLLGAEFGMGKEEESTDTSLSVTLEVLSDEKNESKTSCD